MNQATKRLTRHAIAASIFLTAFTFSASGQVLRHGNSWGIFVRPVLSKGLNANVNTLTDPNYLTGGLGIYDLIRIRNTPARIPLYLIRTELGFNNRTGLFDIQGLGPVRLSSNVIDLSVVLPLSFEISETLRATVGIGGSLGYLTSSKAETVAGSSTPISNSSWGSGFILDAGFLVDAKSTAMLGFRTLLSSGPYRYSEFGFYVGMGFPRKNP